MKFKSMFVIICFMLGACSSSSKDASAIDTSWDKNFVLHQEFDQYFEECGVDGTVAIYDSNNKQWIVTDTISVASERLPASTFKIINLLIALETNTIKDVNEIIPWVGTTDTVKYGNRPEIYHAMSVAEAFEVSAGWVFIELAKKIGRENYIKYLSACNYGNLNLSEPEADFWNFGSFGISPINQVEFVKNLYESKLPFSKNNLEIVKKVMVAEQTDLYTIGAKTGWTRYGEVNTGWWVGFLEANNNVYYFATCLVQDRINNREDFGSCRKLITKKIFNDLGIL